MHFEYGPQGKPFLREDLEFNLSHTENWAALAVSKDAPVGLDIQQYRYVEPEVAERFFSPAEILELGSLSPSEWEDGFFRCWTRKEAIIKGIGRGLSIGLETFDVSLSPDKRAQIRRFSQSVNVVRDWSIHHLDFAENRVGALAVNSFQRSVSIIRK